MRKIFSILIITIVAFSPALVFGQGVVTCDGADCNFQELFDTINEIINLIVVLASSIAAIMFAYAGFLYMTAGGDTGKIAQGHKIFTSVAIGFAFILGAWLIIKLILTVLGVKDADLQDILQQN